MPWLRPCSGKRAAATAQAGYKSAAGRAATRLGDANGQVGALSRELGALQRRAEQLGVAVAAAPDVATQLELRRGRAAAMVQASRRRERLAVAKAEAESARAALQEAQRLGLAHADSRRLAEVELAQLQAQLPRPSLTMQLVEAELGMAHAAFAVQRQAPAWATQVAAACTRLQALHAALQSGRYPLAPNEAVVGGRATATGEGLCALVALGRAQEGAALFAVATHPDQCFHQIFAVFRVWCMGLYVARRFAELQELLQVHRWATGLRGAYVQAFLALLAHDARLFAPAVRRLCTAEWQVWAGLPQRPLGLVNLGALALCALSDAAGLPPLSPLPASVPTELRHLGGGAAAAAMFKGHVLA